MALTVGHTPIESVIQVRVTKERTVTLTHGNYSGCVDALPNDSVFEVVEVRQGALIFVEGTDFLLDGDNLDWSPADEEPSPGATYTAKYHYLTNINPLPATMTLTPAVDRWTENIVRSVSLTQ